MKIFQNTASALLLSILWLGQVQTASMDPRYNVRGPPRPPRPPPLPQYIKKWEQHRPIRNSVRPRPLPMEQIAVVPIFMPPPVGPPVVQTPAPPPLRNYWKSTKIPFQGVPEKPYQIIQEKPFQSVPEKQFPIIQQRPFQIIPGRPFQNPERPFQNHPEKPYQALPQKIFQTIPEKPYQVIPEKPFQSSPPINRVHEYDYHIQTNNIPTHPITIKQVDEKGPIHTIPAPNLSLADKPIVVEEVYTETKVRPQHNFVQNKQASVKVHQYQVTEPNEVFVKNTQKVFRDQQVKFPSDYSNGQNQEKLQQLPLINQLPQPEGPGNGPNQFNEKELLQLLNSHIQQDQQQQQQHQQQRQQQQHQQQHQVFDNYGAPILPQALVQQQFHQSLPQQQQQPQEISYADYQAMLAQAQLFQPDPPFLNQIQQMIASQNFKESQQSQQPPYQFSTYERHAQNSYPNNEQPSTFIATNYNLKAEGLDIPQNQNTPTPNSPHFNQEIFDLEESEATSNNVEQKSEIEDKSIEEEEEDDPTAAFYTTLPNREAAETLASLQAAAKLNNNLKQINQQTNSIKVSHRTPLEIYVPDTQQPNNFEVPSSTQEQPREEVRVEYSVSSFKHERKNEQSDTHQENQDAFGSKIRPKQRSN